MKLSELGEFGLIRNIQRASLRKSPFTLIGIGDDAAALKVSPSRTLLATADMLLDGVHFDLSFTDFYSLGWKSAAVNLSDIAAMGGVPRFCLTSLGIPSRTSVEQIMDFYRGFNALLRAHNTALVGGDTCRSERGMVVSVALLGEVEKKRLLTRSGARAGDRIFVTGTLGDSAAGLEILKAGSRVKGQGARGKDLKSEIRNPKSEIARLIQKHLRPIPRVEWGRKIALSGCASAMIDISDGLSSDLHHICEQSGVGAEIIAERIPFSRNLLRVSGRLTMPVEHYALSGGEDYELLFTVPPAKIQKLRALKIPATEIGTILRGNALYLKDLTGKKRALKPTGYDHFGMRRGRVKV